MLVHDQSGRGTNPITMLTTHDELPDGPASRVLHGDALHLGTLAERRLLVVRETQSHCHELNGITPIPRSAFSYEEFWSGRVTFARTTLGVEWFGVWQA